MDPGRTRLRRAAHVPHRHSIHQHHHARQRALEPSPGAGRRGSAGGRGWRRPPRHLPHQQPGLECVVPQPARLALRGHHHVGRRRLEVVPKSRNDYRVVDRPAYNLVSMQQRADPDAFYLNDGTGRFTLVPWTSGRFRDEAGKPLAAAPEYFGLSAKFTDIDGDGAPDLYVCDDFEDPDMFWLNDGTGTFRAVPRLAVRNTSNSSMAVDFSDVDRDGNVDILVVDMLGRGPRRKSQVPTHTPLPKLIGQIDDRPQWQRNTLLWNRGDGTFAQIAGYAGFEASDWSWDALFLDVDLDGYEDVLATTGHLWDVMHADTWERIRATVPWPEAA